MLFVMNRTDFRCCMPAHLFVPLILRQWPGHSASEKRVLPVAGAFDSGKGFLPAVGASASRKGFLPVAGASVSEKFSFSFLEPSLRT